ncbi:sphingosine 1-phosphate receptor 2 isoform X1 [Bombina bombina]|uniref:sphingosine 1-phosphate receptor 2 isoform X1 n=1 Tax=Bombina bombina TaxID=8345 RepID=UPI00235A7E86|nr:sphingosine 1-phosphate receptor 2 isoform X1 [Bombina bombina]XP_053573996.1 sphingosine 1-phosphate receptor 2 isoform X1 [Bombina bombina]XP_053573997.1 sphingosine 1-phosphate receptor 2 isoform X1 [Bombina bombina]XP_053573998.1 sphingosine 1-phosphate receptor 2 isoform X1 [Bombina bombina]XP_053573999.1 sphingosine 1-phosphate receptor 2 isoform X1 [Bombina bombina]
MPKIYEDYLKPDTVRKHYNYTKENRVESASQEVVSAIVIIICCIIILENLLVLISIWRNKKFHSAMFFFIGNLAFSDLLAGSAYIANILLSGKVTRSLTPVQWFIREGTAFTTLSASVFSLLAIAIERHVAIVKVKVYSSDRNCRMFFLIGACWVISMVIGGLPILGWNCIKDMDECSTVFPLYSKNYILFIVTIFTAILLSIVISYVRIYLIVKSSHAEIAAPQTLALLKTVAIVLGVFIICWLPAFSILLMDFSCERKKCPILYKAEYFFGVATLNSAMNPIIYTLRSKEMRKEFLRVLCCWGCFHKNRNPDRRMLPLRSSSSQERCTQKPDSPISPIITNCTTFV